MRLVLKIQWDKEIQKIKTGRKTLKDAQIDFEFDFGDGDKVFKIVQKKITFADHPIEPDWALC